MEKILFHTALKDSIILKKKKGAELNFKYYWFLFKWFLIGKNHCDVNPRLKKVWFFFHKLLWCLICFSLCFTFYIVVWSGK